MEGRGGDQMEKGGVTSEYCSSGCESGWTIYFQQSGEGPCSPVRRRGREEGEEEEDLSMVSDASSGPPQQLGEDCDSHSHGDNTNTFCSYGSSTSPATAATNSGKRRKVEGVHREQQVQQHNGGGRDPQLDDTASSSYGIPKRNMNLIDVGSAHHMADFLELTLLKERSTWEYQYLSYLTAPTSAKPVSQKRCREDASENDY